ncbi:hypothetical protein [Bacillus sp. AFS040349]|nr:hypothetical protein [Bacillus sp. AFS040349]
METIHRGDGFTIIEKDGEYQISWAQKPYNEPVFFLKINNGVIGTNIP